MSDSSNRFRAVLEELTAVKDEAQNIQQFGDRRRRLGAGVIAAINDMAVADEAHHQAAIKHLEGVQDDAATFQNDGGHQHAQNVAKAAIQALSELRAITFGDG